MKVRILVLYVKRKSIIGSRRGLGGRSWTCCLRSSGGDQQPSEDFSHHSNLQVVISAHSVSTSTDVFVRSNSELAERLLLLGELVFYFSINLYLLSIYIENWCMTKSFHWRDIFLQPFVDLKFNIFF